MPTTKDKLEFTHAMARHTRATVRQCEALMRYATTLQRLAEDQCNREWTERDELKRGRIQVKVSDLCHEMTLAMELRNGRVEPIFANDPRGAVLKIRVPDGFSDDGNGEGICVPS